MEPNTTVAEPQGGGTSAHAAEPIQKKAEPDLAVKTYSQEDVDNLLKKQKKKYEGKVSEAEKLASMTAEEKAEYEKEQRENKLLERERAVELKELKQTAVENLREKGLDMSLASILDYTDADSVNRSIKTVEKVIKSAIEKGIDDKLKSSGGVPKTGMGTQPPTGVEAAFYKLNPSLKK